MKEKSKIQRFITFKEGRYDLCLFDNPLSNIFNDFLLVYVVSHLSYNFLTPIWTDKLTYSYFIKQNEFHHILLCKLIFNNLSQPSITIGL